MTRIAVFTFAAIVAFLFAFQTHAAPVVYVVGDGPSIGLEPWLRVEEF